MNDKYQFTSFEDQVKSMDINFTRTATDISIPGATKVERLVHNYLYFIRDDRSNKPYREPYYAGLLCHMKDGSFVVATATDIPTEDAFCSDSDNGYITFKFKDWKDTVFFFNNCCEMFEPSYGNSVYYAGQGEGWPIEDAEAVPETEARAFEQAAEKESEAYEAERVKAEEMKYAA